MLTASKLSTVAMLAMASLLCQAVCAVPMEEAAPAEEATAAKSPPKLSAYGSKSPGYPSEQATSDMIDIFTSIEPEFTAAKPSSSVNAPQAVFDLIPDEMLQHIIKNMDVVSLKNVAQTNRRNFGIAKEQLLHLSQELKPKLDVLWEERDKIKLGKRRQNENSYRKICAASPLWEKAFDQAYHRKTLDDCPYELLPYNPDERPQAVDPSEDDLVGMSGTFQDQFAAHVRRNICRLAINGGYLWLLKLFTMYQGDSNGEIFSVLGQLRQFTANRAFARDLDKMLKLLATVARADRGNVQLKNDSKYLLMLSTPSVISVLTLDKSDITTASFLLLAVKQEHLKTAAQRAVDDKHQLRTIKVGNVDEFVHSIRPTLEEQTTFRSYVSTTLNSLFGFSAVADAPLRTAIDSLLDQASSGLEIDGNRLEFDRIEKLSSKIHPVEVLTSVLSLKQFIQLYDESFASKGHLALVIMAGMSRDSPKKMEYVFDKLFGPGQTPISEKLEIDGQNVNAEHLAQLAQSCAIVCTGKNWERFAQLLVEKLKATPQLNRNKRQSALLFTTPPAQQVADETVKLVNELSAMLARKVKPNSGSNRQPIFQSVQKVTALLNALVTSLDPSSEQTTLAEVGPLQEIGSKPDAFSTATSHAVSL